MNQEIELVSELNKSNPKGLFNRVVGIRLEVNRIIEDFFKDRNKTLKMDSDALYPMYTLRGEWNSLLFFIEKFGEEIKDSPLSKNDTVINAVKSTAFNIILKEIIPTAKRVIESTERHIGEESRQTQEFVRLERIEALVKELGQNDFGRGRN